jgi:peptide/nickel transport system substrate-binding protein
VLVALALLAGAGCGSGDDGGESADDSPASASCGDTSGGSLTVGLAAADSRGFDPAVITGGGGNTGGYEMTALFDTLMRWNPESAEFEPHLAESLEADDDVTQWTLTLRPDVTFGNGDPLDAAAVIASIERFDGADVSAASFYDLIESMEATDDRTVVFTLDGPWGGFPYFLAGPGGMVVNAALVEEIGADALNADPPAGVGAGPFVLTRYAAGEDIEMAANEDYWGGDVCVDELRIISLADDQTTYETLRLGEADVAFIRDSRVIAQAQEGGMSGVGELSQGEQLMINVRPGTAGEDLRVRQAIAAATDMDLVNDRAREGTANAAATIVPPDSPLFADGMTAPGYDAERAAELVEEAKADGWDGQVDLVCSELYEEESIAIEGLYEGVGMEVDVSILATPDLIDRIVTERDFDVACWSLNVLPASPWARVDGNLRSDSETNRTAYAEPDMDAALQQLRVASTPEDTQDAIAAVQDVWNETLPGVMYAHSEEWVFWNDDVEGVAVNREGAANLDGVTLAG